MVTLLKFVVKTIGSKRSSEKSLATQIDSTSVSLYSGDKAVPTISWSNRVWPWTAPP